MPNDAKYEGINSTEVRLLDVNEGIRGYTPERGKGVHLTQAGGIRPLPWILTLPQGGQAAS